MIIVAGKIYVQPNERAGYLDGCLDAIEQARRARGCLDFHLSPDPLEAGRINVHEEWASVAAVEAFRGDGPDDGQQAAIVSATVVQHEVASSTPL